jgi:MGT family glycosyltransferase
MSKFLFIVPPFIGHINPTLGIGSELLRRGHEVTWIGIKELPKENIPEGGNFIVPLELKEHENEINVIMEKQDNGHDMRGAEVLKFAMEETYIPFCNFIVSGILRIIDDFQPDVVVHDENMFAGAICAVLKKIPYVTSIAVPPGILQPSGILPKVEEWQTQTIINLQKKFGIKGESKIINSPNMNMVYTSREFIGNIPFPDHYKFVGPIVKGRPKVCEFDFDELRKSDLPKIYVSLGTVLNKVRKEFFAKIIEALADQPVTVIAATIPDIFDKWPDNFIVRSFVPQSELLPYVDAVIYHGGFNTVNETLLHGIPMIIIPLAYDQFHIATLVVNSGSGLRLKFRRLKSEDIKTALREILQNPKYKQAALKIEDTLKSAGGTDKATDYLEEFAHKYFHPQKHENIKPHQTR